jgi:hypothetical protein
MIQYSLKKIDGSEIKIRLPENASEIKLSQVIDFEKKLSEFKDKKEEHEYLIVLEQTLSEYFDTSFLELEINGTSAISAMVTLQNQIWKVIYEAKPELSEGKTIVFKGEEYEMPTIWKNTVLNKIGYNSISLKQAIEVLQVQYNYTKTVKAHADQDLSSFLFSKALSEIAFLLLKKGEEIPTNEDECERWANQRITELIDIDYQTAININYWFESYMNNLQNDRENFYFFDSDDKTNAEEQKAEMIAASKSKGVFEKIGYKSIIPRVAKFYNNNIVEAMKSKFTDAVKLISIENSKQ